MAEYLYDWYILFLILECQQTYAIQNALKKIDEILLEHHLKTCVREAMASDQQVDTKVNEIVEIFKRK